MIVTGATLQQRVSAPAVKNPKSAAKCAEHQKSATPIAHFLACNRVLYHIP